MLTLNGAAFSCGRSTFLDHDAARSEPTAKIFIRIRLGQEELLARLDTGAAWSVMAAEVADGAGATDLGTATAMQTPYGRISGSSLACQSRWSPRKGILSMLTRLS